MTTTSPPPGTYLPSGATAPVADPGGYYSAAGATAPTLDPAGTYSSPYALNRLIIGWEEDVPDNVCLAFNSVTAVQNYFGVVSTEATLANQFFDPNVYGTSYSDAGATLYFTREGLGQRPHLLGVNLSALTLAQLQAINGSVAITFNGWNYSANIDLSNATNFSDAAQILQTQLNAQAPVLAQTTGDTIQSQTVNFTGDFKNAQLTVTSVQSGTMEVGGLVDGNGVQHSPYFYNNQIIYQHSGPPGGAGTYSTFGHLGSVSTPEAMTETYGLLTLGTVTSGSVAIGSEVTGPGIPNDTAVIANLSGTTGAGSQWLINNAVDMSGHLTFTGPPLDVAPHQITGATQNNDYFDISPNGAFGFDKNPSTLGYMTNVSGTAADQLGLSQASGAIDSSPGGQHPTIAQFMNNTLHEKDQFGNPVHYGSYQGETPNRFTNGLTLWETRGGLGEQFLSTYHKTTIPAGQSTPVTDPPGTHSGPGATAPLLGTSAALSGGAITALTNRGIISGGNIEAGLNSLLAPVLATETQLIESQETHGQWVVETSWHNR